MGTGISAVQARKCAPGHKRAHTRRRADKRRAKSHVPRPRTARTLFCALNVGVGVSPLQLYAQPGAQISGLGGLRNAKPSHHPFAVGYQWSQRGCVYTGQTIRGRRRGATAARRRPFTVPTGICRGACGVDPGAAQDGVRGGEVCVPEYRRTGMIAPAHDINNMCCVGRGGPLFSLSLTPSPLMTDTEKHLEGGHGSASVSTLPAGTDLKRRESHAHEYGTEVEMERNFSFLSCLGLAFAMLNSWNAMTASLQLTLPSGGPVAVVWGLLVAAFGTMMNCISL